VSLVEKGALRCTYGVIGILLLILEPKAAGGPIAPSLLGVAPSVLGVSEFADCRAGVSSTSFRNC
jgi:hypothetical protein